MALRGNLRDFTITQLLNLINLANKTGTLIVDGSADQAHVAFQNGKLAFARIGQEDNRLATVLHRANKLTANQYRAIVVCVARRYSHQFTGILYGDGSKVVHLGGRFLSV